MSKFSTYFFTITLLIILLILPAALLNRFHNTEAERQGQGQSHGKGQAQIQSQEPGQSHGKGQAQGQSADESQLQEQEQDQGQIQSQEQGQDEGPESDIEPGSQTHDQSDREMHPRTERAYYEDQPDDALDHVDDPETSSSPVAVHHIGTQDEQSLDLSSQPPNDQVHHELIQTMNGKFSTRLAELESKHPGSKLLKQDTIPPQLVLPSVTETKATSPSGAEMNFHVSAYDNVDGYIIPQCTRDSGFFQIGNTNVFCYATDRAGNIAFGSFTIRVTLL